MDIKKQYTMNEFIDGVKGNVLPQIRQFILLIEEQRKEMQNNLTSLMTEHGSDLIHEKSIVDIYHYSATNVLRLIHDAMLLDNWDTLSNLIEKLEEVRAEVYPQIKEEIEAMQEVHNLTNLGGTENEDHSDESSN